MNFIPSFSPSPLSYVAALRGIKPHTPGSAFAYAVVNCRVPDMLIAMAASNPEGRFYGLMADAVLCGASGEQARTRQVGNVSFICATPAQALALVSSKPDTLPPLDYVCCDESEAPLVSAERTAFYDFATKTLRPGGLLATNYRPSPTADGVLKFLVREFAPEMNAEQACSFLLELKKLGKFFFKENAVLAAKLDQAIVRNMPDDFFGLFDDGSAGSSTFDTMVGLIPRGFTFVGDSSISASYIEMSVPPEAQPIIVECRSNQLYEPIKDFAQNRSIRGDIWCKEPAVRTADLSELFGGFSFGITVPREKVPSEIEVQGKTIALSTPFYEKLIDLMTLMPVGIGDILAHPSTENFVPQDVVDAVQVIIACGIGRPMRGLYRATNINSISQPRLVGSFNKYLDKASLTGHEMPLASPVLGDAMTLSPRDALVMQALVRAGLANSVAALLPELQRLALNPAQAARVMDAEPTEEIARQMIEDAVSESIVQWYAYGLLEAA